MARDRSERTRSRVAEPAQNSVEFFQFHYRKSPTRRWIFFSRPPPVYHTRVFAPVGAPLATEERVPRLRLLLHQDGLLWRLTYPL